MIEIAEQRAAAGEHDALVDDVGRQLRRRMLEGDLTASTMALTGSVRLSAIWRSLITSSLGTPFIRSRPLISIIRPSPSSGGQAEPISF